MQGSPIRSILIVGGGTAGWMAANLLATRLRRLPIEITLVESPDIRTVGVGEATVPAIRDYFKAIGVTEAEVMQASQGTVKLGIEFRDWRAPGTRFFHPFGRYGVDAFSVPFHQYWLKRRMAGDQTPLSQYCLPTQAAMRNLMLLPPEQPVNDLGVFDWAIHFDAGLFARFLAQRARDLLGVRHLEGTISGATRDAENGRIASVTLTDGRMLEADLFVDCSGFRSLLLGQTLEVPYEDWTHLLPCDRAVAMPCAHGDALTPYTRSTALAAGWQWRIPLQHRIGNGYVYSSRHISDDEATATLIASLEGEALAEPNMLRFRTGHRTNVWEKNCVALGLAAGFLEPLESTSIVLIQSGIERLLAHFPDRDFDPSLADEFNRITALEYARIRDFLLLHYWGGQRPEKMWQECRALDLPETLARRIRAYKGAGKLPRFEWDSFQSPSWLSMFAGFEIWPSRYDPLADQFTTEELGDTFEQMRAAVARAVSLAGTHEQFIAETCAAPAQNAAPQFTLNSA
ncbi:tryptophan halogenase family protein [Novosphingobium sp. TCA1]|uniref:Tryptophan halogenase n=1 Tax=Novosphingobium pentaromativorans TaxID=205844 RepID=A0A2W5P461_9SPHN|nr:tryptophan halogenase family protein [Novosphingobium sp. TCA1]PZQ57635.1 MAG: tryptophan halogenase [Novosphingobium pentaromativorans]GFE73870.1 tryptophan halogenase [Novosphingobium sp. TCA1]